MIKTTISICLIMISLCFCIMLVQKQNRNYYYSHWNIIREETSKYERISNGDDLFIVYRLVDTSIIGKVKTFFMGDPIIETINIDAMHLLYCEQNKDTLIIYKPYEK